MRPVGLFSLREWILRLREARICPRLPGWEVAASEFSSWADSSGEAATEKAGWHMPFTSKLQVSDGESSAMDTGQSSRAGPERLQHQLTAPDFENKVKFHDIKNKQTGSGLKSNYRQDNCAVDKVGSTFSPFTSKEKQH